MATGVERDEALLGPRPPRGARGRDVQTEIEIPSFEAALGTRELVTYEAQVRCKACIGRGSVGFPEPCPNCGGAGTVTTERRIRLLVPPGVEDGTLLRVTGDGNDAGAGSIPGDLLVRVKVEPPPTDRRIVRYAAFVLLIVAIATFVIYVMR